jgi:hypothetical protein
MVRSPRQHEEVDEVERIACMVVDAMYAADRAGYEAQARRWGMTLEQYAAKAVTDLAREHEEAPYQNAEDFWPREAADAR